MGYQQTFETLCFTILEQSKHIHHRPVGISLSRLQLMEENNFDRGNLEGLLRNQSALQGVLGQLQRLKHVANIASFQSHLNHRFSGSSLSHLVIG